MLVCVDVHLHRYSMLAFLKAVGYCSPGELSTGSLKIKQNRWCAQLDSMYKAVRETFIAGTHEWANNKLVLCLIVLVGEEKQGVFPKEMEEEERWRQDALYVKIC